MKKAFLMFMLVVATMLCFQKAEAKWWIFGKGNEEISLSYLYINKISYDEAGTNMVLYKDSLQNNLVSIAGKARVKKGKVGYVRITRDNKATWEKAKVADDGAFEYSFTPQLDKKYQVYVEVSDTSGIINNVDGTYKEITVVNLDIATMVREALNALVKAYQEENESQFMSRISSNFSGDYSLLENAIRKDFNAFDNIRLITSITNITSGSGGKIFVAINFNRAVTSSRNGQNYSDKGITEFIFKNEGGSLKLSSMKKPLIFGLSDADNVASGTVNSPGNEPVIVIDNTGTVVTKTPGEEDTPASEPADNVETGTIHLVSSDNIDEFEGYNFDTQEKVTGLHGILHGPTFYNSRAELGAGDPAYDGKGLINLGPMSLNSVKTVPTSGYVHTVFDIPSNVGSCFAIHLANHKYAVVRIMNTDSTGANFEYKYQPDGSPNF